MSLPCFDCGALVQSYFQGDALANTVQALCWRMLLVYLDCLSSCSEINRGLGSISFPSIFPAMQCPTEQLLHTALPRPQVFCSFLSVGLGLAMKSWLAYFASVGLALLWSTVLDQNGHCRWEQKVQFRTSSGHLGCKQCPPEQLNALESKAMAWHLLCITSSVILIFTHLSCIATWKTLWVSLVQAGEIHTSVSDIKSV